MKFLLACSLSYLAASFVLADWSIRGNLSSGGFSCNPGGLNVSGSYRGSKWTINANLGSGWFGNSPSWCNTGYGTGWGSVWGSGSASSSWSGSVGTGYPYVWRDGLPVYPRYLPYGYASGPVDSGRAPADWSLLPGVTPQPAPGTPVTPPPPPPTTLERAHAAGQAKDLVAAADLLREHIKIKPEDVEATRQLAMVLIENKDIDGGIALLRDLYVKDPTLADRPYLGTPVGQDVGRLRDMTAKLVARAHKLKSPSAWLGVVLVMQAEGRKPLALKMLDRAKDAGIERAVSDHLTVALSPPPPKPKTPTTKPQVPGYPKPPAPPTPGSGDSAPPSVSHPTVTPEKQVEISAPVGK
jgi:ribosomal protein S15P/S13E